MELKHSEQLPGDRELVRGCLANNRRAQRALFEQYKVPLYTLVYRLLNDSVISNDVLQEAYIEIFRSIGNFRFESTLYTWMRTIVIRSALVYMNKKTISYVSIDEIPERSDCSNNDFTTEHLERAILSLPEQARTVFVLIETEGYKHHEVAEMLKISSGTSKSQLNYAKKLLRNRLST